jgi:hypothetical protein
MGQDIGTHGTTESGGRSRAGESGRGMPPQKLVASSRLKARAYCFDVAQLSEPPRPIGRAGSVGTGSSSWITHTCYITYNS